MEKTIILLNGRGGSGKDTLCDIADDYFSSRHISSITPILPIARMCGWDGQKDEKGRKLLSELKNSVTEYNDLCTKYVMSQVTDFLESKDCILFIDIREGKELDKTKSLIKYCRCITMLVDRGIPKLGNDADDNVDDYKYDYTYINNKSFKELEPDFIRWFQNVIIPHE